MAIRKVSGSTAINRGVNAAVGQLSNMAGVINAVTVTSVLITDASYNTLDDTAVSSDGGYLKIIGSGFKPGCTVYIGGSPAASTTYISSTEVRATTSVLASNTYLVYVLNTDNTIGIKLNALVVSGTPSWDTSATLGGQIDGVAFSIQLSATSDSSITYSLAAGSSVPSGTTLHSNGLFTGTVGGLSSETTYSFGVVATDVELQDVSRTFSVTVSIGDLDFYRTSLLIQGDSNTWITDASSNNHLATVVADTRVSAFSPYNTNWSSYFASDTSYVTYGGTSLLTFGTNPYTIEFWFNGEPTIADYKVIIHNGTMAVFFNSGNLHVWLGANPVFNPSMSPQVPKNKWTFIQIIRTSTATNGLKFYVDGVVAATGTDATNWNYTGTSYTSFQSGFSRALTGYMADLRVSSVARTPGVPTSRLSSDADTKLLTFQNRNYIDNSPSGLTVTKTGNAAIKTFGPFAETDITTGSGYFDGTGDYLTIPASNSFNFGTDDYTIEGWVYSSTLTWTLYATGGTTSSDQFVCDNGTLYWNYGAFAGISGFFVAADLNTWTHVAASRGSGTTRVFKNGVLIASNSTVSSIGSSVNTLQIGRRSDGFYYNTGYMSNIRVIKGTALYTANFTPPNSPLTAVSNTVLLTLQNRVSHNNSVFVDESGLKSLTTRTGNAPQGTLTPFSSDENYWSQYYANNSYRSYATTSTGIIDFKSTATFTVEGWINITAAAATSYIMLSTTDFGSTVNWYIGVDGSSRKMVVYWYTGSVVTCLGTTVLNYGQWYFLQFRANNGAISMGLNGVQETLTGTTTLGSPGNSTYLALGCERTYTNPCYLYDVRISNNVRSFTLPTAPMSSDANTTLLTARRKSRLDESSLNTTLLASGLVQPYTPFGRGARATYSPAVHGGSVYFDGSGDRLTTTHSPLLTLGTTDHTIEFWMYPNGIQNAYGVVWEYSSGGTGQATNDYYFALNNTGTSVTLLLGSGGAWAVNITLSAGEYTAALNNWSHVVITRSGTAFRLFINGVLKGYTTSSQSIAVQGAGMVIGDDGAGNAFKGYVSDFSMKVGSIPTAYQTSNTTTGSVIFTPPTAPVSIDASDVVHHNFIGGGVLDATSRNTFETLGGSRVSNAVTKYGNGSIFLNGSSDYIYLTDPPIPTLGDFTVEFWARATSIPDCNFFAFLSNSGSYAGLRLNLYTTGALTLLSTTNGSAWQINAGTAGGAIVANTWYHIAVVRNGGTFTVYKDGTSVITSTAIGATTALLAGTLNYIGAVNNGGITYYFPGYLDDFRVSKFARYTGNFTAPTTAFLAR